MASLVVMFSNNFRMETEVGVNNFFLFPGSLKGRLDYYDRVGL